MVFGSLASEMKLKCIIPEITCQDLEAQLRILRVYAVYLKKVYIEDSNILF